MLMFWKKYQDFIVVGILLMSLAAVFGVGYTYGQQNIRQAYEEERLELQQEIFVLEERIANQNLQILQWKIEREELVNELENEAMEADGSGGPGVGSIGGLQRLEERWGGSP